MAVVVFIICVVVVICVCAEETVLYYKSERMVLVFFRSITTYFYNILDLFVSFQLSSSLRFQKEIFQVFCHINCIFKVTRNINCHSFIK